ncbi:MAG TPA: DinB family protein [Ktedonobacterales bacterium]
MPDDENMTLLQSLREQRLVTLALVDQIGQERWREPLLPGERTPHAMASHLLAWDEWAAAVFEVSALRELPVKLRGALGEVDAFNARAVARFNGLDRADLLMGLQSASDRLLSAATGAGGVAWAERRIAELAPSPLNADGAPSRGPSVAGLLRMLLDHEREHGDEFSGAFGVTVDIAALRAQVLGEDPSTAAEIED